MTVASIAAPRLAVRIVGKEAAGPAGRIDILDEISFDASPGRVLSVLGPSGCGKTSLLRAVAGLDLAFRGVVRVDGVPVSAPGRDRGIVFQEPRLLPWMTVRQNVAFALDRPDDDAVADVLRRVGLDGFEGALPRQLSGGMAQRAALARALVCRPRALLLDEPFGALDAFTRTRMQRELRAVLDGTDVSTLLVTHDVDEAILLSDEVLVLSSRPARVIERVKVDLPRPRHPSDQGVLTLRGALLRTLEGADGIGSDGRHGV